MTPYSTLPYSTLPDSTARSLPPARVHRALDLKHPELQGLYRYWSDRSDGRAMPDRTDIDPAELVPWLSHLILVDVVPPFSDIRFRVVGTWVADRTGRDDTGKTMGEIGLTDAREQILQPYLLAARTGLAYRREGTFLDRFHFREHIWAERLLLPLSYGGTAGAMVLSAIYFLGSPPEADRDPAI